MGEVALFANKVPTEDLPSALGSVQPATALVFLIASIAVVLTLIWNERFAKVAQLLALAVLATSFFTFLTYLYGWTFNHRYGAYHGMSFSTAALFVVMSMGILASRLTRGFGDDICLDLTSMVALRNMLPIAILVPTVFGWITIVGEANGLYRQVFAVSALVDGSIVLFAVLAWRTVVFIRRETELSVAYARSHHIADVFQKSILENTMRQNVPGLEVASIYVAAMTEAEVGGDLLDILAIDEHRVAFVLGDVSGKGLEAALRGSETAAIAKALLMEGAGPSSVLERLNSLHCKGQKMQTIPNEGFICLSLAVLDVDTGMIEYSSAGTEPCVVIRPDAIEEYTSGGMPIGVSPHATYDVTVITLSVGDLVLFVTDGISEARNGDSFLGLDGFARIAAQNNSHVPLKVLVESIFDDVRSFAGGNLHDDACVLAGRRV